MFTETHKMPHEKMDGRNTTLLIQEGGPVALDAGVVCVPRLGQFNGLYS